MASNEEPDKMTNSVDTDKTENGKKKVDPDLTAHNCK